MLRNAARDLIAGKIGKRTDLDAEILAEMLFIQDTKLEGKGAFKPWFLESVMTDIGTTVADTQTLALPADFLGEIDGQGLWIYDATADPAWAKLKKDDFDIATERYSSSTGKPVRYSLQAGNTLVLHPVPDAAYLVKMRYYQKATSLATDVENAWLANASDMLIYEVARVMAKDHLQNDAMAGRYEKDAGEATQRVFVESESRKHTNRFYSMGDD